MHMSFSAVSSKTTATLPVVTIFKTHIASLGTVMLLLLYEARLQVTDP